MTTSAAPLPGTNRPVFLPGQVLDANDLRMQHDVDDGLRRLHHRMLHGWGICQGLAVSGARGGISVALSPGYALDSSGRELVVTESTNVPVPPVAAGPDGKPVVFALVIRWTEEAEAFVSTPGGSCNTQGAVRRSDAPTVAWLETQAAREGYDVILGEVSVQGCKLVTVPDPTLRRLLNPPPTPYSSAGSTAPGRTGWQVRSASSGQPWAVWTEVDTAEAGFGDVPVYLARVAGTRLVEAAASPTFRAAILDGMPYVERAEAGRFRLVVPLPPGTSLANGQNIDVNPAALVQDANLPARLTSQQRWYIEWIGVQQ
ncbi:hypothetical protein [Arthrobacter oryzae]|uniref:hypothetical protein n=1 Tax=Arthrobacter oryzae TaxID=409290 RepID=UPI00278ABB1D|nr:hypothetical protein [Arthrobacter oryzae]MDQ0079499.1 hypothetical protein [Arthrobacter oryzae]